MSEQKSSSADLNIPTNHPAKVLLELLDPVDMHSWEFEVDGKKLSGTLEEYWPAMQAAKESVRFTVPPGIHAVRVYVRDHQSFARIIQAVGQPHYVVTIPEGDDGALCQEMFYLVNASGDDNSESNGFADRQQRLRKAFSAASLKAATLPGFCKASGDAPDLSNYYNGVEFDRTLSEFIRKLPERMPTEPVKDLRPVVVLRTSHRPIAARKIKYHLQRACERESCPSSDMLFRRGDSVVHLSRNRLEPADEKRGRDDDYHVNNDLTIKVATKGWFADRVERSVRFAKLDKYGSEIPTEAPQSLLDRVPEITTGTDFPKLSGTVEAPTLRANGSLLDEPGYDAKSGLFYDPGTTKFPKIPEKPTKADAMAALGLFIGETGILCDFAFKDETGEPEGLSKSVALAMILTALARRTLPSAPMFVPTANEAQSGKTLLAETAAVIATGRTTPVRPWPTDEYQRQNTLGMYFEAGDPVILFDNIGQDVALDSAVLNLALTEREMGLRRLGSSSGKDEMKVPTNATLIGTGNHVKIQGDMTKGRTLIIKIVPDQPFSERTFRYRNLIEHVIENRPALVAAGLTILRAYAVAKNKRGPSTSRHRQWGDLIANAIAWLGLPDPVLAEGRSEASDPQVEEDNKVVHAWAIKFKEEWATLNELISADAICSAIAEHIGVDKFKVSYRNAGPVFRDLVGLTRLGFRIECKPGDGDNVRTRYRLKWMEKGSLPDFEIRTAEEDFGDNPSVYDAAEEGFEGY